MNARQSSAMTISCAILITGIAFVTLIALSLVDIALILLETITLPL